MPDIIICQLSSEVDTITRIYSQTVFQDVPETLPDITSFSTQKEISQLIVEMSRVIGIDLGYTKPHIS